MIKLAHNFLTMFKIIILTFLISSGKAENLDLLLINNELLTLFQLENLGVFYLKIGGQKTKVNHEELKEYKPIIVYHKDTSSFVVEGMIGITIQEIDYFSEAHLWNLTKIKKKFKDIEQATNSLDSIAYFYYLNNEIRVFSLQCKINVEVKITNYDESRNTLNVKVGEVGVFLLQRLNFFELASLDGKEAECFWELKKSN